MMRLCKILNGCRADRARVNKKLNSSNLTFVLFVQYVYLRII